MNIKSKKQKIKKLTLTSNFEFSVFKAFRSLSNFSNFALSIASSSVANFNCSSVRWTFNRGVIWRCWEKKFVLNLHKRLVKINSRKNGMKKTHQQLPPLPISDLEECTNISLNTSHG